MKKLSMDKLVNTVINERKAKGLTQVQLAEATGINRAMIGRLENSDYIPSIDQLQRLGENLGFEVTDLFVEEEETPKDMVLDKKYRIAVAGTGYVGLSIATLLAQHNHVSRSCKTLCQHVSGTSCFLFQRTGYLRRVQRIKYTGDHQRCLPGSSYRNSL